MNTKIYLTCLIVFALLTSCTPKNEVGDIAADAPEKKEQPATSINQETDMDTEKTVNSSFIPAEFTPPILVKTEQFMVVPLGPELTKIDYDAYMSSIEHLQTTFTRSKNWPRSDLTNADAILDMETEQERFENRTSFAYAILTPDGTRERGCVYVYPSSLDGYDAVVRMWVTKAEFDAGFDAELYAWVNEWVADSWPFSKVAYPGRAIDWTSWDTMVAAQESQESELKDANLKTAEAFIDAFYSFDQDRLKSFLTDADETAERITYYQGWAEGGNYIVLDRRPCEAESSTLVRCPITVQDDPVVALQTGFNVTDTFHITFTDTKITSIDTSSNDQPIYYEARKWVESNMPEVMTGPCLDRNKGGSTPGDCARAMTEGYKKFYAVTQQSSAE